MDPSRADRVRVRLFEALTKIEPLDTRVLARLAKIGGGTQQQNRDRILEMASELQIRPDELAVSFEDLEIAGLNARVGGMTSITAFGREFLRALEE